MKLLISLSMLVLVLASEPARAVVSEVGSVIQVTRRLKMTNSEPTPPKEVFIDLGSKDGVKLGSLLEITRKVPTFFSQAGVPGPLVTFPVGLVKVIAVGEAGCVGRMTEERSPNEIPAGEVSSFMLGDEVTLKQPLPGH